MPMSRDTVARILKRLMPHVEQHDPYTFLVRSRSRGGRVYTVSIASNWGNGQCSCEDWSIRRQPALRKNGVQGVQSECWHVKEAKRFWCYQTVLATAPNEALAEGVLDPPPEADASATQF